MITSVVDEYIEGGVACISGHCLVKDPGHEGHLVPWKVDTSFTEGVGIGNSDCHGWLASWFCDPTKNSATSVGRVNPADIGRGQPLMHHPAREKYLFLVIMYTNLLSLSNQSCILPRPRTTKSLLSSTSKQT